MKSRLATILMVLGLGLSFTPFGLSATVAALEEIASTSFGLTAETQVRVQHGDTSSQISIANLSRPGAEIFQAEAATAPNTPVPTVLVTTTADIYDGICDANCSLRDAVDTADSNGVPDVIGFAIPASDPNCASGVCEIKLNSEIFPGADSGNLTTIDGSGTSKIVLDAQGLARHFFIGNGVNFALNDLTLIRGNGNGTNPGFGGSILVKGVFGTSSLLLNNVTLRDNTNTLFPGEGGAINCNAACALTITNSTISNNISADDGGGIMINVAQSATLTNVTISGNQATGTSGNGASGGGIYCDATTFIGRHLTVTGNSAVTSGGGLKKLGVSGSFNLGNTIVAGNSHATSPDVSGTFTSSGYNFIGKNDGSSTFPAGNPNGANEIVGTIAAPQDPLLLPLGDNGGPTRTHALLLNSPAIDKGHSLGTTNDQRGSTRPFDNPSTPNGLGSDGSDIGAFEVQPQTLTVNKTADSSNAACDAAGCSLREAIGIAAPGDTINLMIPASDPNCSSGVCIMTLTNGEILIDKNLTINGPGADRLVIDGGPGDNRIFQSKGGTVTIRGVTLQNGGSPTSIISGTAVFADGGSLTLDSVVMQNNHNHGFGNALSIEGGVNHRIINSAIINNSSTNSCGGFYFHDAIVAVANTTISGNSVTSGNLGGGGCVFGGTATFRNSTITNNSAGFDSGGIFIQKGAGPVTVNLGNTIVAGNTATSSNPDINFVQGTLQTAGGNLIGDNATVSGTFPPGNPNTNGDRVGQTGSLVVPMLAPLTNAGGSVPVQPLLAGSPAVNNGINQNAVDPFQNQPLQFDARGAGFPRIVGTTVDMGAFEAQNTAPAGNDDNYSTAEDTPLTVNASGVLGNDTDGENNALTAVLVSAPANAASFLLNADGSFSYTPNTNFNGADSFTYKANDGQVDSDNIATVTISVSPVNDAPTISSTTLNRQQGAPGSISTIAAVSDVDNAAGSLMLTATSVPAGLSVTNITNNNGTITATIAAGCGASPGANTIVLQVSDGDMSATNNLIVNVTGETTPPVIDPIADVVVYLPFNSTAVSMPVTFPLPTASDNCSTPTIVTTPVSGSVFNLGSTVVNVTATDAGGNQATGSFTVRVLYNFAGFFQPVDNLPTVNLMSAGQSVPIKFSLSGDKGLNILAGNSVSAEIACDAVEPGSTIEETVNAGSNSLTYDASLDRYVYVWKTNKAWRGTCRILVVRLNDGTNHLAKFRFR